MEFFKKKTAIEFMRPRRRWYALSAALVLTSLALLGFRGLNLGIDFTGGVVLELAFPKAADLDTTVVRCDRGPREVGGNDSHL